MYGFLVIISYIRKRKCIEIQYFFTGRMRCEALTSQAEKWPLQRPKSGRLLVKKVFRLPVPVCPSCLLPTHLLLTLLKVQQKSFITSALAFVLQLGPNTRYKADFCHKLSAPGPGPLAALYKPTFSLSFPFWLTRPQNIFPCFSDYQDVVC